MHTAFQNQGILPGILLGLRSSQDRVPAGETAFLLASTKKAIEDGNIPVKLNHFLKQKGGNSDSR